MARRKQNGLDDSGTTVKNELDDSRCIQMAILESLRKYGPMSSPQLSIKLGITPKKACIALERLEHWNSIRITTTKLVRYYELKRNQGD